jgi:zinc-binding in reverse transcriptase
MKIYADYTQLHLPDITHTTITFFLKDLQQIEPIMTATSNHSPQNALTWNLTTSGIFTVNSTYKLLNNPGILNQTLNDLWALRLPPKIKFFIWLLLQNKLQTAQNLTRKNWPAIQSCSMCNTGNQETTEHLFVSCPTARALHHSRLPIPIAIDSGTTVLIYREMVRGGWSNGTTTLGCYCMDNLGGTQQMNLPGREEKHTRYEDRNRILRRPMGGVHDG